ncbi:MAG TPA: DsbA family protein [Candidatus Nanoarchaeia archaeon]|nr:DsbA family protein [Candidatus Nanoarchaeia archaeon]
MSDEKSDVIKIKKPDLKHITKNKWAVYTIIFAAISIILLIILLTGGSFTSNVSKSKITPMISSFVNTEIIPEGGVEIVSIESQSGVYVATINVDGDVVPLYFTKDGKFISQGTPLISIDSSLGADTNLNAGTDTLPTEKVDASPDNDAVLGDVNAPVTIIEFSDFQCPFCERFYTETLPLLKTNYIDTGKVKLIYRDYPLDFHPMAQKSAEAAECVRAKGGDEGFWKYHDQIYENQASLTNDNLKKWAKELGYNIDTCLDSGEKTSEVLKDLSDGESYGVTGTPTFFINGQVIEGAYPYATFQEVIDAELAN